MARLVVCGRRFVRRAGGGRRRSAGDTFAAVLARPTRNHRSAEDAELPSLVLCDVHHLAGLARVEPAAAAAAAAAAAPRPRTRRRRCLESCCLESLQVKSLHVGIGGISARDYGHSGYHSGRVLMTGNSTLKGTPSLARSIPGAFCWGFFTVHSGAIPVGRNRKRHVPEPK